jgi:hypothetical protein
VVSRQLARGIRGNNIVDKVATQAVVLGHFARLVLGRRMGILDLGHRA